MHRRNIKFSGLSIQSMSLNSLNVELLKATVDSKWLSYFLKVTALILWLVFNTLAIESYQFSPYPLVVMNLVMYFILATVASPSYSEESKPSFKKMINRNQIDFQK